MASATLNYNLNKNNTFSIAFDKTYQNIHLLTTTNSIVPSDIWVPATKIAPPESSLQLSFSYMLATNNNWNVSFSAFYKKQYNLIDYNKYSFVNDTTKNPSWEQLIMTGGVGNIYGLEFSIDKSFKKVNFQISYTFMYNNRVFEKVNMGKPFPFNYDRRHFVQTVVNYNVTKKFNVNAIFIYGSGYPITLVFMKQNIANVYPYMPTTISTTYSSKDYIYFSDFVLVANKINNYRLPAYHRLDLSFNWSKQKKKGVRTWSVNIYNVYNHINILGLEYLQDQNPEDPTPALTPIKYKIYKMGLFPILPSISYSYKF